MVLECKQLSYIITLKFHPSEGTVAAVGTSHNEARKLFVVAMLWSRDDGNVEL